MGSFFENPGQWLQDSTPHIVNTVGGAAAGFFTGGPVGAVAGGVAGFTAAENTAAQNRQARDSVQDQRGYETYMSNTAHQREAADLRAAGINPNISGNTGASTPASPAADVAGNGRIDFPSILAVKQLSQKDAEIGLEKQKTAAYLAKNLSDLDIQKMQKILMQKGLVRANVEGTASEIIQRYLNVFGKTLKKNQQRNDAVDSMYDQNGVQLRAPVRRD